MATERICELGCEGDSFEMSEITGTFVTACIGYFVSVFLKNGTNLYLSSGCANLCKQPHADSHL